MPSSLISTTLGLAVLGSLPGLASAQRAGAPEVDRVQLAVADSGGAACPRDAVLTAWAHTNGPGVVRFVIRNEGGGKTGELKADAVAGAAGTYLATYRHTFKVTTDVETKYVAEVVGSGQTSNWVPFTAACGPQARAEASAAGASSQPPARTATESRARSSVGEATDGGGAPPARTGAPPAQPAPETKPNPSSESGGSSKPNTSPDGKTCGATISVTRHLAVTQDGGKATALVTWMAAVASKHPDSWKDWDNAKNQSLGCKRSGATWTCTASARPCAP
jgi:hypothetical protein